MFTARERGFELKFVTIVKMINQILYDIKQVSQSSNQVREDTLTKEDILPKLKLKQNKKNVFSQNLKWLKTISYLVMLAKKY